MVYAKNEKAQTHLAKQFANKSSDREYIALLDGFLKSESIEHESYLYRDPQHRKRFASISAEAYTQRFGHDVQAGTGYRLAKSLFLRKETYALRITLVPLF